MNFSDNELEEYMRLELKESIYRRESEKYRIQKEEYLSLLIRKKRAKESMTEEDTIKISEVYNGGN